MNKRILMIVVFSFLLAGCAKALTTTSGVEPYGFFSGFLHGILFPLEIAALIISFVSFAFNIPVLTDAALIGYPNTGVSYYIGFSIGSLGAMLFVGYENR